jgi:hypothetical protein
MTRYMMRAWALAWLMACWVFLGSDYAFGAMAAVFVGFWAGVEHAGGLQ